MNGSTEIVHENGSNRALRQFETSAWIINQQREIDLGSIVLAIHTAWIGQLYTRRMPPLSIVVAAGWDEDLDSGCFVVARRTSFRRLYNDVTVTRICARLETGVIRALKSNLRRFVATLLWDHDHEI
jgi:hypothetical protein